MKLIINQWIALNISFNFFYGEIPQVIYQKPQLFGNQFGIARTFYVQIPFENLVLKDAIGENLCGETIIGTQVF